FAAEIEQTGQATGAHEVRKKIPGKRYEQRADEGPGRQVAQHGHIRLRPARRQALLEARNIDGHDTHPSLSTKYVSQALSISSRVMVGSIARYRHSAMI